MIHVDPFAYITLASLCKALFIANDLPEHSIVGNENNKTSSQVAREWLLYLQNTLSISINEEQPIFVEYVKSTRTLTCKVMRKVLTTIVPDNIQFKHYFTPPKTNLEEKERFNVHISVDGFCSETNTIYEFNGCHFHGCPCCNVSDDADKVKYEKTMERLFFRISWF